ncbi:MAG: sugar kinase [Candidatus Riflebacteria bacterium]|nr:sugar kinase [Candidatus Riflebacteria bacterium]
MPAFESIVVVTRRTALEELTLQYNTRANAQFYLEQQAAAIDPGYRGGAFDAYAQAHEAYHAALRLLRQSLPTPARVQVIDRHLVPTFQFDARDLVVILGPDGLVVNTAKYLDAQVMLAFNPDPSRIDGILLPFTIDMAPWMLPKVWEGGCRTRPVSMAQARLNNGQSLLAVNDLFVGARTHVSARYRIACGRRAENHSSSGIIVSTGAGSTGWFQSIVNGACGVAAGVTAARLSRPDPADYRLDWSDPRLYFAVREPFVSRTSQADLVFGRLEKGQELVVTSHMPEGGVIFSDGLEQDALSFPAGAVATIGLADRQARLAVP